MILRQINPEALAEAHAMHFDETCHMLQQCSLTRERAPDATDGQGQLAPLHTAATSHRQGPISTFAVRSSQTLCQLILGQLLPKILTALDDSVCWCSSIQAASG